MTREEAAALKPGDIISGANDYSRVLTKVWVEEDDLHWHQTRSRHDHSFPFEEMTLVKKVDGIINNYPIF